MLVFTVRACACVCGEVPEVCVPGTCFELDLDRLARDLGPQQQAQPLLCHVLQTLRVVGQQKCLVLRRPRAQCTSRRQGCVSRSSGLLRFHGVHGGHCQGHQRVCGHRQDRLHPTSARRLGVARKGTVLATKAVEARGKVIV